jgi:hypothetical protein
VLFRLSYVRIDTPGWSRTSGLCRIRAVLSPLSYRRLLISVSWRVAERLYASGTVLNRTGRSQEGGQRREAGGSRASPGGRPPAREARSLRQELNPHLGRTKGVCCR